MSFAWAVFILFFICLFMALVFVALPRTTMITWNEKREALMYKTAYWCIIISGISLLVSLVCFVKGY